MPYLSKTFNHVIADSSVNTWDYEKRTGEIITFKDYLKERKGYTDQFFADLKEMLQQTNLTITFDDDNNTFNVFDMDFMVKCISSCTENSWWVNSNYYRYCGVRPFIILPRISNAADNNNTNNINYSLEMLACNYAFSSYNEDSLFNNTYYWIHANTPDDAFKRQVNYTIKIYYNTNYIICSYISFSGNEIPLFCFIQGEIITTKQKAVYLSASINSHYTYLTNKIAIPSQNIDKNNYYDYLPSISNYAKLGAYGYIFDRTEYPSANILTKLSSNDAINTDIFLNKLTAFGGLITFDNAFDVTRYNASNLPCQILTNTLYTINNNNYYCPGYTINPYNIDASNYGRYIFKL